MCSDPTGAADQDDADALINALMRAHGAGFSESLRQLIVGDTQATREAVVRHLGFPDLGGTCQGRTASEDPPSPA